MDNWAGVIMAAGEGRRMVSKIPKPLHKVCGKEMIRYPVELLRTLGVGKILVVVSPSTELPLRNTLGNSVDYVVQPAPNGTGDAALWAVNALPFSHRQDRPAGKRFAPHPVGLGPPNAG